MELFFNFKKDYLLDILFCMSYVNIDEKYYEIRDAYDTFGKFLPNHKALYINKEFRKNNKDKINDFLHTNTNLYIIIGDKLKEYGAPMSDIDTFSINTLKKYRPKRNKYAN